MPKKATFKCIDCKGEFEYAPIEGYDWAHPTICSECDEKRQEAERALEVAKKVDRMNAEIAKLPYEKWDCALGNNTLRNTIGRTVFHDGKPTNVSLWVQGDVGCGKTRSICFVAKTWIERGGHVRYAQCVRLLGSYSKEFMNGDAEHYALDLAQDRRILILDDYGVGKITERGAELLYIIADERLIRGLPTWITSNFMPDDIQGWFPKDPHMQEYAKRVARRIKETFKIIKN